MKIEIGAYGSPPNVGRLLVENWNAKSKARVDALREAGKDAAADSEHDFYALVWHSLAELRGNLEYEKGTVAITIAVEYEPPPPV